MNHSSLRACDKMPEASSEPMWVHNYNIDAQMLVGVAN